MRNEITVIGDSYIDKQIVSGSVLMVQSMDGNELQYDKLDATLDLHSFIPTLFVPKDSEGLLTFDDKLYGVRPRISILVADPSSYKPGAVVLYKHNGTLVGKYYMSSIKRVGKTQYRIDCVSPVGMLAKSKHYGGIYDGVLFSDLIAEIIGGVVPYTVSADLDGQRVYGWLPVASRRDNLHQALFAMGASAQKDANGDLYVGPLFDDSYTELPGSRVYTGGTVRYPNAASRVSVIEHTYVSFGSDASVTLFEGIVAAEPVTTPNGTVTEGTIVLFDNPMHDLAIENGTILESGVNYAVLGPTGNCKLTGQQYTHTARETIRPETAADGEAEDVVSVANATLVSVINSENVVNRLHSYYSAAKTVSLPIVVDVERAGSTVLFEDPFGDLTKGIITSMDINMSGTLKADAEIVSDYSPGSAGNFYTHLAEVTESGTFTVPEESKGKIRVVLIGGGDGGSCGSAGEKGTNGSSSAHGEGGTGGAPGNGGKPGKIYIVTIPAEAGQTIDVEIGAGGTGADYGGTPGEGGATIFGAYTSNDGVAPSSGYAALTTGMVYAIPGTSGVAGGAGQKGNSTADPTIVTYNGEIWYSGATGEDDFEYGRAYGGGGGGPAVGANGGDGKSGVTIQYSDGETSAEGGEGGAGATPIAAENATIPGSGGMGGHGGGGGGGGGGMSGADYNIFGGDAGSGGSGGKGGNGAPGIVLIYY